MEPVGAALAELADAVAATGEDVVSEGVLDADVRDKIGQALLALKEVEYLGAPRSGNPFERAEFLVQQILTTQEARWKINDSSGGVIARVKRLRTAILADMIAGTMTPEQVAKATQDQFAQLAKAAGATGF